jgi:hypothetical protein
MAKTRLMNELQALQKEKWCTVEVRIFDPLALKQYADYL